MNHEIGTETLVTVAGIVVAFALPVLIFRVQREVDMEAKAERIWLPWADRLLLVAMSVSLVVIALGVVQPHTSQGTYLAMSAVSLGNLVLIFAYPFAVLAHYRIILGGGRTEPRENPEPWERNLVVVATVLAVIVCVAQFAAGR
jgi:hypothetical protein